MVKPRRGRGRNVTGGWLVMSAAAGLAAAVLQSLTWLIVALTCAGIGVVLGAVFKRYPELAAAAAGAAPGRAEQRRASRDSGRSAGDTNSRRSSGAGGKAPCGCRAGARCPGSDKCECKRCKGKRRAERAQRTGATP